MDREQIRARDVLDDLLACDEGMTAWEIGFIEDMDEKRGFDWSDKQIARLDIIFERVC